LVTASASDSFSKLLEAPLQHGFSAAAAAAQISAFCEVAMRTDTVESGRPPAVDFVIRDASIPASGMAVELLCDADKRSSSMEKHIGYFDGDGKYRKYNGMCIVVSFHTDDSGAEKHLRQAN
jgi:hypothetical protein